MRISSVCRPSRYSHAVRGQRDALLEGHPHALPVPLRHGTAHREFQRVDGVGVDGVVAGARDAALLVPLADRRAGAVAVEADRVRVDVGVDALGPAAAARAAASTALPVRPTVRPAVVRSCMRLARRSTPQPGRRGGLAGAQHVAVALGVGAQARGCQPDVAVHQVARLDRRAVGDGGQQGAALGSSGAGRPAAGRPLGWNHGSTPRSWKRCRIHQATSSAVVVPTSMTAGEKASSMTSWASRLSACSAADLLRQPGLQPADRQVLGRHQPVGARGRAPR